MINENVLYHDGSSPESAAFYFDRPRIKALIGEAVKRPLTTVAAGAGYGKTQAVSSLSEDPAYDCAWLQLSVLDNHIYRFWERFVYGFSKCSYKLKENLKAMSFPETPAAFDKFLRLFAAGLGRRKRTVLILDDFHLIYQNAALSFLENLILARIKNFSVILISRRKLDIDSAGLLSKGLLSRITEDDLRFTREEVFGFYEAQGLGLDEETAGKIYRFTEGWIFAVCLIGLSLKKQGSRADPLSLAKDDIYELIDKEIFSAARNELKKLLVRASLPDFLPKDLLELIAAEDGADAPSLVAEMLELNQFIRCEPFSGAYRIHNLFRDFLSGHRDMLTNSEITRIHYIAARWYERHGFLPDAAEHYEKCGRYNEIFGMILAFPRQCPQESADTVIRLIDRAPREFIEAKPVMKVVKSYYLLNNNKIETARALLLGMRQTYEALPPSAETRALLGEIYIVLALLSIIRQDYEFEELFKKADEFLPAGSALVGQAFNIAEGINITGIKDPAAGELQKYYEAMFRAMPCAARVMNGCNYGAEYLNAADTRFMTGDIREAEKSAYEAVFRARSKKQYGIVCMAEFILIRIYTLKGDYAAAAATLKQMKQRQDSGEDPGSIPLYDIIEGWLYVKLGETQRVRKWIRRAEEGGGLLPPVIIGREYLVRSDSLLAEEKYAELLALMAHTDAVYLERGILYAVIQNKITKAIIYHYMGDHDASIEALNGAWRLSNPNNLIIQYIEYGSRMRTLISAAKKNPDCIIPQAWLDGIYKKSSSYAKQLAGAITDYRKTFGPKKSAAPYAKLSDRELEILTCLSRGMTRNEIADTCYLSANTVKSILQSVYSKLGAAKNADAVHMATELGLISK